MDVEGHAGGNNPQATADVEEAPTGVDEAPTVVDEAPTVMVEAPVDGGMLQSLVRSVSSCHQTAGAKADGGQRQSVANATAGTEGVANN